VIDTLITQEQLRVIIDWTKAAWIDPMAIGLLLARRHALLQKSGELKFARMRPEVRTVFSRFRMTEFFESYATLEDAIASFDEEWIQDGTVQ